MIKNKKRLVFILVVAAAASICLYVYRTYSFIEITGDESTLLISNQAGDVSEEKLQPQQTIKKILKKGVYEITAGGNDSSFFQSFVLPGGGVTKAVRVSLKKEVARSFVGSNPSSCMTLLSNNLLSYPCKSPLSNLSIHKPSTETTPTYTEKPILFDDLLVEDILDIEGQPKVLVRASQESHDVFPDYSLYDLTSTPNIENPRQVVGLDGDTSYQVSTYQDGRILFNESGSVLFYKNFGDEPEKLNEGSPGEGFKKYSLASSANSYTVTHSDLDEGSLDLDNPGGLDSSTSKIFMVRDGVEQMFTTKGYFSKVFACGDSNVCAMKGSEFFIYAINDGELEIVSQVNTASNATIFGDFVLVTTNAGILRIDPNKGTGSYDLSLENQQICGIKIQANRYILCIIGGGSDKNALLIDPTAVVQDVIDKKINTLRESASITGINIYGNTIFISPNYGERAVLSDGSLGYQPKVIEQVDNEIHQAIKNAEIDTSKYLVQTTYLKKFTD